MVRKFLLWFFRNRETGEITIVQAPNLALWVVIAAGALLWFGLNPAAHTLLWKLSLRVVSSFGQSMRSSAG